MYAAIMRGCVAFLISLFYYRKTSEAIFPHTITIKVRCFAKLINLAICENERKISKAKKHFVQPISARVPFHFCDLFRLEMRFKKRAGSPKCLHRRGVACLCGMGS